LVVRKLKPAYKLDKASARKLAPKQTPTEIKTYSTTRTFTVRTTSSWTSDKIQLVNEVHRHINRFLLTVEGKLYEFSATSLPIIRLTPDNFIQNTPGNVIQLSQIIQTTNRPFDVTQVQHHEVFEFLKPFFLEYDLFPYLTPISLTLTFHCIAAL
jgi:hypothetical protein